MKICRDEVVKVISSNTLMQDLYLKDHVFNRAIQMLCVNYELSEKQLVNIIFVLCDGRKNTEDELVEYITHYGSMHTPLRKEEVN